jgi:hypothetical protein
MRVMLFTVYPQGPPPRSGPNWLLIILGGCGGCAVLVVLATVLLGFWGIRVVQRFSKDFEAQKLSTDAFLTNLQQHRYNDAWSAMTQEGRQAMPVEKLREIAETAEKRLGPMQSWGGAESVNASNDFETGTQTGARRELVVTYRRAVNYKKGKMNAVFTFRGKDALHPETAISEFALRPVTQSKTQGDETGKKSEKDTE